jgi:hypothetical protein
VALRQDIRRATSRRTDAACRRWGNRGALCAVGSVLGDVGPAQQGLHDLPGAASPEGSPGVSLDGRWGTWPTWTDPGPGMVQGLEVTSMAPFQEEAAMPPGPREGPVPTKGSTSVCLRRPLGADAAASAGELQ